MEKHETLGAWLHRVLAGRYVIWICCGLFAASAWAQHVPDAGSLLRQSEPQDPRRLPEPAAPAASVTRPAAARPNSGPTLIVTRFTFEGNERFGEAELQELLAGYLQRRVRLAELELAAADVARYYRTAGWAARVIVPPQQIEQGVILLKVIEGVLGRTRFAEGTDTASLPMAPEVIVAAVQGRVQPGGKLSIPDIERGLLLADDLPGLSIDGSQVAGSGEAQTDILLVVSQTTRTFGEVTLDNLGARSTGATRATLRLGMNSPLRMGDQFDLMAQLTEYMRFLRATGTMPLGSSGLRLNANASALRYRVGTPEFALLAPRGSSRSLGADLLYPLIRASSHNAYLDVGVEDKRPYNSASIGVLSDYNIRNLLIRLDLNVFDGLAAGGITTLSVTGVHGHVDLSGSPATHIATDASTYQVQGSFELLRYRLLRTQRLGSDWALTVTFSGQATGRNLDSAEKFYLGGPHGVRAYPGNEAGGSQGRMFNLDLRWKLPVEGLFRLELDAFYDWGHITVNPNNLSANGQLELASVNRYSLRGYGLGLVIEGPYQTRLTAVAARRIGGNPGAQQAGSLDRTQLWLTLGMNF